MRRGIAAERSAGIPGKIHCQIFVVHAWEMAGQRLTGNPAPHQAAGRLPFRLFSATSNTSKLGKDWDWLPQLLGSPPPSRLSVSARERSWGRELEADQEVGRVPLRELWLRSRWTRAGRAPLMPQESGRAPVMLLPDMLSTCSIHKV